MFINTPLSVQVQDSWTLCLAMQAKLQAVFCKTKLL